MNFPDHEKDGNISSLLLTVQSPADSIQAGRSHKLTAGADRSSGTGKRHSACVQGLGVQV